MAKIDKMDMVKKTRERLGLSSVGTNVNANKINIPSNVDNYAESLIASLFKEEKKKKEVKKKEPEKKKYIHHEKPFGWDVPIDEDVLYFDPELSYELTKYKPITAYKGLDFDPNWFNEAARTYEKTGSYTKFPKGCKPYIDYWKEQKRRCIEGYEVNGYRITGDNYFFLNFYRMNVAIEDDSKAASGRSDGFPTFSVWQYVFFHYIDMCEIIGKDAILLKARGLGFSEMMASLGACPFFTKKHYRTVFTCAAEGKLTPLLTKCWTQLDWLNMHTVGGMHRTRAKINNAMKKRASLLTKDNIEYGVMSEIEGIVADDPNKVRGDRCERLIFEEFGSNKHGIKSWIQGKALITVGGKRIGIRIGGGCLVTGSKVWTKSGHMINIEDLQQSDGIIGFKNNKANIETISYVQEPMYKECVRINTNVGYLECSEDHPILYRVKKSKRKKENKNLRDIWFEQEWVTAKDLLRRKNSNVIYACDKIDIFGEEKINDPYMIGLLIGDGSYGQNKLSRLCNCDSDIWYYVKSKYKIKINKSYITKDNKIYYECTIYGTREELIRLGIQGQTKANKRLPSCYNNLCKEDAANLIAGLWDTDGYISKRDGRMEFCKSSKELLYQLQELLYKFGIWSSIREHKPLIREDRKDKNSWFRLCVEDCQSILNFKESIPIKIKYKIEALDNAVNKIKSSEFYKHRNTIPEGMREIYVKSIDRIGIKRVYNLTADDSHTYLANNIITHNTG